MFWLVFWFLVCVAILAYGIRRMANHDYRFGSGLFKSLLLCKNAPALYGSISYFIAFINL